MPPPTSVAVCHKRLGVSDRLDSFEQLLDDVVGAGANEIEAVDFDVTAKAEMRTEARRQAVAAGNVNAMEDLGPKVSYLALADGTPVYDVDRTPVGVVEHVLADEGQDIFHGVIVAPSAPSRPHRFAHRDQIADLYERGVLLSVPGAEMHEPGEDAPARNAEGTGDNPVQEGLRRAWEWLSRPR